MSGKLVSIDPPFTPPNLSETKGAISTPLTRLESSVLPEKDFDDIILLVAETDISKENNPLNELMLSDPTFSYLKNIMNESSKVVIEEMTNAGKFLLENFGVDVKVFKYNGDTWMDGEHKFVSYYISPTMKYRPVFTKERGKVSGEVREGGFALIAGSTGLVTHGKYGGKDGKFISGGNVIFFGYYNIKFNDNTTRIIHYRSTKPLMSNLEHIFPVDHEVFDFGLKTWGQAVGTSKTSIKDTSYHLSVRNVITFPGTLQKDV